MCMSKSKCGCTFFQGFSEKECKYHKTHCHSVVGCKKKILKDNKYCKQHQGENVTYPDQLEGHNWTQGGSDF